MSKLKIGILQTGHLPDDMIARYGDYDAIFRALLADPDFEIAVYPVVDNQFPPGPEAADAWLITGSRHGVYEDHAWIAPLEELVRAIDARKAPLVGICFGHQVIAQALGGRVEKFAGGWSVGRVRYDLDGKDLFLNTWHQDQVVEPPARARVLGGNDFCVNGVLAYDDHIWTVQPHPEFDKPLLSTLIESRGRGAIDDRILDRATDQLDAEISNDAIVGFIKDFFRKAHS